ncbi:MAG: hypothetical protein NTX50_09785 [Candidatus Sumerlaeota bacterium]|nr:hypothetical protein [Candidatus Sumerlaeota bacterium]
MKLPQLDSAVVERAKIAEYLLNPYHRYGASKCRFFMEFGFHAEFWQALADALIEHAERHEVSKVKDTPFGPRFEIETDLIAPDGRRPCIKTVWQMDRGQTFPRLITAYPLEAEDD